MTVYRIGQKKYIKDLSGKGAELFGGRWNMKGSPVVYASESIALAVLEYLVKSEYEDINNLEIAYIEIPGGALKTIDMDSLPATWNSYPAPDVLKQMGTEWLVGKKGLALRVPSVVAPDSFNILINPGHRDFTKVKIRKIVKYSPDTRIKK